MSSTMPNSFELLKTKEIYAILDGDTKYGEYEFTDGRTITISMPYLSGPDICSISMIFGYYIEYSKLSRWQYFDNLFDHCIKNDKCSDLFLYLFSKEQFSKLFPRDLGADEIDKAYQHFFDLVIDKINGILYYGGNELVFLGNQFIIKTIGSKIQIQAPRIKSIDREYVKNISARALDDIEQGNFDSAITKARTLVEETFCYVIEKKSEEPSTSGDINKLYRQVKDLYNMHPNPNADRRVNTLLSGLEKIISAVAEMRNKDSDAHGVGAARLSIEEHHARLFVNAAISMADFILSVENKQNT